VAKSPTKRHVTFIKETRDLVILPACLLPAIGNMAMSILWLMKKHQQSVLWYAGVFHHLLSGRFCLHIMFQDVASSQDFINITSRLHKFWSFPPKLNQPSTSKQLWIMWTTIVQRLANHEFRQTGMWPWGKKKSLSSRPSSAAREPTWMSQEVQDHN